MLDLGVNCLPINNCGATARNPIDLIKFVVLPADSSAIDCVAHCLRRKLNPNAHPDRLPHQASIARGPPAIVR